jgi:hypothetical protein
MNNQEGNMKAVNHLAKAGNADIVEVSTEEAKLLRANAEVKVIRPARENGFTQIQPHIQHPKSGDRR